MRPVGHCSLLLGKPCGVIHDCQTKGDGIDSGGGNESGVSNSVSNEREPSPRMPSRFRSADVGDCNTNYLLRASVAGGGLTANIAREAVYIEYELGKDYRLV
jgi:hypothetical protein